MTDGLVEVYLNRRNLFQSSESLLSLEAKVIHPRLLSGWRNVGSSLLSYKLFGQQFCEMLRMAKEGVLLHKSSNVYETCLFI